jgi:histidyl-tRNA synthetase
LKKNRVSIHCHTMTQFNITNPSGFPELPPALEQIRQQWLQIIRKNFGSYGYQTIETPLVEREENLLGKGGNPKEMYVLKRLLDGENDKSHSGNALRFDQTVPLALYVARHRNEIAFPFKRQVIGPVFRGERAQKGRYRQFDQCDIDIIGQEKLPLRYDAEVVAVIADIFTALDIGDFVVRINNRKILIGFMESLGIGEDKIKPVLDIIDDLEKLPTAKILAAFAAKEIEDAIAQKILSFVAIDTSKPTFLDELKSLSDGATFQTGIAELASVIESLEAFGVNQKNYVIDLKIARGLDYYTGTVYETKLANNPEFGSVCSGGRYADLAGVFTGKKFPGVGISIGLTRLLYQAIDAGLVSSQKSSPSQVAVIATDEKFEPNAIAVSRELRALGIANEIVFGGRKLSKKMKYAEKIGVPLVVILGENEVAENKFLLKNMKTGEQSLYELGQLAEVFASTKID